MQSPSSKAFSFLQARALVPVILSVVGDKVLKKGPGPEAAAMAVYVSGETDGLLFAGRRTGSQLSFQE